MKRFKRITTAMILTYGIIYFGWAFTIWDIHIFQNLGDWETDERFFTLFLGFLIPLPILCFTWED